MTTGIKNSFDGMGTWGGQILPHDPIIRLYGTVGTTMEKKFVEKYRKSKVTIQKKVYLCQKLSNDDRIQV